MDSKKVLGRDKNISGVNTDTAELTAGQRNEQAALDHVFGLGAPEEQLSDGGTSDVPVEANNELIRTGMMLLGGFREKDLNPDGHGTAIRSAEQPVCVRDTRQKRLNTYNNCLLGKGMVAAGDLLGVTTSRIVKNGNFDPKMIRTGKEFLSRILQWIITGDIAKENHAEPDRESAESDLISWLYVDGKPVREFVSEHYGYDGADGEQTESEIIGAYIAMIASGMEHPITLVRPVTANGIDDMDIRNVGVDLSDRKKGGKSRMQKLDAIQYAIDGEEYRKYCEAKFHPIAE